MVGIAGIIIIIINFIFSYKGFKDHAWFDTYKFEVDKILVFKDYKRLITSGFLHVSWMHLILNMISLYAFSSMLESGAGIIAFVFIYVAGLVGGNLLALWIHKSHADYSAVGASGAVCGLIFASVALFPGMGIGLFGLPINIPGWLYGLLYVLYSIYGIRSNKDNIGHEAHLGGALMGLLVALAFYPSAFLHNYITILIIAVPTLVFMYLIIAKPQFLLVDNFYFKTHKTYFDIDDKYNDERANKQAELDRLLDKISSKGIESLSKKERQKLDEYSR